MYTAVRLGRFELMFFDVVSDDIDNACTIEDDDNETDEEAGFADDNR